MINKLNKYVFGATLLVSSFIGIGIVLAADVTAPVSGFARSFILGSAIANATISVLETGQTVTTDSKGKFGPFLYPVGKPITLVFKKTGYATTQSATVIMPPGGLTRMYDNITFQVPSIEAYYILSWIIGEKVDEKSCHVAMTITAYHKTLDDIPQGEANATVTITPAVNSVPFYFDIYKEGPLKGKTNPFTHNLKQTSEDGGVLFANLPARDEPYTISAFKAGVAFTEAKFLCRSGVFINVSPPRGPMALN